MKHFERFHLAALLVCIAAAVTVQAQTFTTVASFDGTNGFAPGYGTLVQAINGNIYGTTTDGGMVNGNCGAYGCENVFEITPSGKVKSLYTFCSQFNCPDGEFPQLGMIQATNGNLYGTTSQGADCGNCGTIFEITPAGKFTTFYYFCPQPGCGTTPLAGLLQAIDGTFYGITEAGGTGGAGTVFKITPTGTFTTLYSFCATGVCSDGAAP